MLETAKIYFSVSKNITITMEVTNLHNENIVDADVPLGNIEIPKTGEDFPNVNYTLGASLLAIALVCGISLF